MGALIIHDTHEPVISTLASVTHSLRTPAARSPPSKHYVQLCLREGLLYLQQYAVYALNAVHSFTPVFYSCKNLQVKNLFPGI